MKKDLRFSPVNYYLYTKYKFEVARDWDIIPAISAHYNGSTVNEEISLQVNYSKALWLGVSYRMSDLFVAESIVPMIGFNITDYVRLGYSYDFNLTHLSNYISGTHELFLTIRFKSQNERYKTPRFAEWD
jgi:type IX secretion system PorP/SprF family membrane protein